MVILMSFLVVSNGSVNMTEEMVKMPDNGDGIIETKVAEPSENQTQDPSFFQAGILWLCKALYKLVTPAPKIIFYLVTYIVCKDFEKIIDRIDRWVEENDM